MVTPIPKEGDHEQANNNRPISLLPILSKVCERAALNQIMTYLVENERLSTKQNGNKKWHSTETALIHSTDAILTSIDKKELSAMVLLDMSKAFDSINHNILLLKLQDVGISNSSLAWFQSYLDRRYQVVRVHSTLSNALPLTSGVPQGRSFLVSTSTTYHPSQENAQQNVTSMILNYRSLLNFRIAPMPLLT